MSKPKSYRPPPFKVKCHRPHKEGKKCECIDGYLMYENDKLFNGDFENITKIKNGLPNQ